MSKETFTPWDSAEVLNDDEVIIEYLKAAREANDTELLKKAADNVARAKATTQKTSTSGRRRSSTLHTGDKHPRRAAAGA